MDNNGTRLPLQFSRAVVCLASMILLAACGVKPSELDNVVSSTLTAERAIANSISTSVAATMIAVPTATSLPEQPTAEVAAAATSAEEPAPSNLCPESMADLRYLSAGYLEGSRFFVSFEKASAFQNQAKDLGYILQIRGNDYSCSILSDNPFRIFCIGRYIPVPGNASFTLISADSTCTYETPFEQILIPPAPLPTEKPGPYS